jgi:hypothetical protein
MLMTLDPGLAASLLGALAGIIGAAVRWTSEMTGGRSKLAAWYLVVILLGGGFMGVIGSSLARLSGHPQWANVSSAALSASAAIAFGSAIGRLLRKSES